ncbi:hypothetical protein BC832DRAFT_614830 [Gaertneriomyces semiglobifer]|nr:hypothetical protein BC832DRAFT_614830 [Gaertneriomyces semiglobifer]
MLQTPITAPDPRNGRNAGPIYSSMISAAPESSRIFAEEKEDSKKRKHARVGSEDVLNHRGSILSMHAEGSSAPASLSGSPRKRPRDTTAEGSRGTSPPPPPPPPGPPPAFAYEAGRNMVASSTAAGQKEEMSRPHVRATEVIEVTPRSASSSRHSRIAMEFTQKLKPKAPVKFEVKVKSLKNTGVFAASAVSADVALTHTKKCSPAAESRRGSTMSATSEGRSDKSSCFHNPVPVGTLRDTSAIPLSECPLGVLSERKTSIQPPGDSIGQSPSDSGKALSASNREHRRHRSRPRSRSSSTNRPRSISQSRRSSVISSPRHKLRSDWEMDHSKRSDRCRRNTSMSRSRSRSRGRDSSRGQGHNRASSRSLSHSPSRERRWKAPSTGPRKNKNRKARQDRRASTNRRHDARAPLESTKETVDDAGEPARIIAAGPVMIQERTVDRNVTEGWTKIAPADPIKRRLKKASRQSGQSRDAGAPGDESSEARPLEKDVHQSRGREYGERRRSEDSTFSMEGRKEDGKENYRDRNWEASSRSSRKKRDSSGECKPHIGRSSEHRKFRESSCERDISRDRRTQRYRDHIAGKEQDSDSRKQRITNIGRESDPTWDPETQRYRDWHPGSEHRGITIQERDSNRRAQQPPSLSGSGKKKKKKSRDFWRPNDDGRRRGSSEERPKISDAAEENAMEQESLVANTQAAESSRPCTDTASTEARPTDDATDAMASNTLDVVSIEVDSDSLDGIRANINHDESSVMDNPPIPSQADGPCVAALPKTVEATAPPEDLECHPVVESSTAHPIAHSVSVDVTPPPEDVMIPPRASIVVDEIAINSAVTKRWPLCRTLGATDRECYGLEHMDTNQRPVTKRALEIDIPGGLMFAADSAEPQLLQLHLREALDKCAISPVIAITLVEENGAKCKLSGLLQQIDRVGNMLLQSASETYRTVEQVPAAVDPTLEVEDFDDFDPFGLIDEFYDSCPNVDDSSLTPKPVEMKTVVFVHVREMGSVYVERSNVVSVCIGPLEPR